MQDLGDAIRKKGENAQNDTEFLIGTSLEVGDKILSESILGGTRDVTLGTDGQTLTQAVEVDVERLITDLSVETSADIFRYLGAKDDDDALQFVGNGIQGGYAVYEKFVDADPTSRSIGEVISGSAATLATLFDDETGAKIAGVGTVGWAGLAINIALRAFGRRSCTEVNQIRENAEVENDLEWGDNIAVATRMSTDFVGRLNVGDGEIRYELNGVNPKLLQPATYTLDDRPDAHIEAESDSDGGTTYRGDPRPAHFIIGAEGLAAPPLQRDHRGGLWRAEPGHRRAGVQRDDHAQRCRIHPCDA